MTPSPQKIESPDTPGRFTVLTGPFSDWHVRTLGGPPEPEVVDTLAAEWMEGALPDTWFSASPARVRFRRELIADWVS
jgi:hypothetical protein